MRAAITSLRALLWWKWTWMIPWFGGAVLTPFNPDAGRWFFYAAFLIPVRAVIVILLLRSWSWYGGHRTHQKAARVRTAAGEDSAGAGTYAGAGAGADLEGFGGYLLETSSVFGVRAWSMHDGLLYPLLFPAPIPWHPGENHAVCFAGSGPLHRVPAEGCKCGFWAYNSRGRVRPGAAALVGVIEGTGQTLVGTKGFRCENARIVAMLDPRERALFKGKELYEQLHQRYPNVPLYPTIREMLRAHPLTPAPEG